MWVLGPDFSLHSLEESVPNQQSISLVYSVLCCAIDFCFVYLFPETLFTELKTGH